jgi:pyruvate dehydrogenase phosphatase
MLRRAWKPLAATTAVLAASGGYYYYWRQRNTFEVRIRIQGPDGKSEKVMRRFPLLSKEEVDTRLQQNASFSGVRTLGGLVCHTTASLASNDPFEDANMNQVVARDADDPASPGELLFYGVLDGHSGPHTSRLLSQTLIRAVVSELSSLIYEPAKHSPQPGAFQKLLSVTQTPASVSYDGDPKYVSFALQNAFTSLDDGIISHPLDILAQETKAPLEKGAIIPDLSQHPLALPSMQAALSGQQK